MPKLSEIPKIMQHSSEAFYKKRDHFFGFQIFRGRAIEGDPVFIRNKFFDGLMVLKVYSFL